MLTSRLCGQRSANSNTSLAWAGRVGKRQLPEAPDGLRGSDTVGLSTITTTRESRGWYDLFHLGMYVSFVRAGPLFSVDLIVRILDTVALRSTVFLRISGARWHVEESTLA